MHDLRALRDDPAAFDANWARRGLAPQTPAILKMDEERRGLQTELQQLQQARNEKSKQIGQVKAQGGDAQAVMDEVAALKTRMTELEGLEARIAEELNTQLASLPNMLADDVPDGKSEDDNKEVRKHGEPRRLNAPSPDHVAIGEGLGMMDFETAAKMSGSRFVIMQSGLARLERALAQFMLDTHTQEHGYTEVSPPLLVRDNAMFGTGQLPKFADDLFECFDEYRKLQAELNVKMILSDQRQQSLQLKMQINEMLTKFMDEHQKKYPNIDVSDLAQVFRTLQKSFELDTNKFQTETNDFLSLGEKLQKYALDEREKINTERNQNEIEFRELPKIARRWLIPTAEVSLTNIVAGNISDADELPLRLTAWTPCFRSEAGAAGKDTKGMIRQHQFYKVEMVSVTAPDKSIEEHERMTECAETILKKLGLQFRTMALCAGDIGFGSRKTYDIEVWLPGQQKYREISSCSNCWDFQARRMKARFKAKGEKDTQFVHTLNGSGVAVGRALIAVLENYHNPKDGSVTVPEVLKPYMGGMEKIVPVNA